jgi:hypothetical protein
MISETVIRVAALALVISTGFSPSLELVLF